MRCSCVVILLSLLTWISIGFYVGGGYAGLSQTLVLLEKYGPAKGRGNPALDPPPNMWVNPETNQWEPRNPNDPGNLVPQVFHGIQYFLIAWAVFMFINSIVLIVDNLRSKKVIQNKLYQGSRVSESAISCTAWLVGYCTVLAIAWFVQACFAVLPLLEYRITMQRCWDLKNPAFASYGDICVDLIQYGLVQYKDTRDEGYALVCGTGGNYNDYRGNLQGFCEDYYPTFILFIIAFTGASVGMISMILFAINHSSTFSYLKVRRYENPARAMSVSPSKRTGRRSRASRPTSARSAPLDTQSQPSLHYHYPSSLGQNGVNMYNPNYGSSVIMAREEPKPVPEVMSFPRYHSDDEDLERQTIMTEKDREKYYRGESEEENDRYSRHTDRSNDRLVEYSRTPSPPPYEAETDGHHDDRSEDYDDRRDRRERSRGRRSSRPRSNSHRRQYRASSDDNASHVSSRRERHRRHRRHHRSEDERSARATSEDEHVSRASSHRRHQKSSRRGSRERIYEEDESPASDYYMKEDRDRRRR